MGKHRHKGHHGKKRAKTKPPKPKAGACQVCGEEEPLRKVSVQIDGKTQGRSLRLCRSCTAVTVQRFGDHPIGAWK